MTPLTHSLFSPTFPTRRSPHAPTAEAAIISPKQVQKTARYPTIRASGEFFSLYDDPSVAPAEMIANMVSPMDVPNWEIVLNTAPARP